jgi:hypothetical protein
MRIAKRQAQRQQVQLETAAAHFLLHFCEALHVLQSQPLLDE